MEPSLRGAAFRDEAISAADVERRCAQPACVPRDVTLHRSEDMHEWPLWEVFIRSQHGLAHKHVGSVRAADAQMALENARDVYTRRNEGVSIWVVRSAEITASSPEDKAALFEPAQSKVYRHPTFYEVPDEVKHI
jgi:ring-1,2-phenylacetyl-CoA epoxidase subunit PaaB